MEYNKANTASETIHLYNSITQETLALPFYCVETGTVYARSGFHLDDGPSARYMVLYTISGTGLLHQGDGTFVLKTGLCTVIDCSTPYRCEIMPQSENWNFHWCTIAGVGVDALVTYINTRNDRPIPVSVNAVQLQKDLDRIRLTCTRSAPGDDLITCIRIHSILFAIIQAKPEEDSAEDLHRDDVFSAASYMQNHYAEKINISDVANRFYMSKYYFIRQFSKYFGTTPYNFLLLYRIERAKELLISTKQSVSDISCLVGFGNESNFSTQFSRVVGLHPSDFRKNNYRLSTKTSSNSNPSES